MFDSKINDLYEKNKVKELNKIYKNYSNLDDPSKFQIKIHPLVKYYNKNIKFGIKEVVIPNVNSFYILILAGTKNDLNIFYNKIGRKYKTSENLDDLIVQYL